MDPVVGKDAAWYEPPTRIRDRLGRFVGCPIRTQCPYLDCRRIGCPVYRTVGKLRYHRCPSCERSFKSTAFW